MTDKKINALVISEIPAPYRVDIFLELSKWMNLKVYFQSNKDQSRSPDYFVKSEKLSFEILDNESAKNNFKNDLKNINKFDMVIAYHPVCKAALQAELLCKLKGIPYFVNTDGAFVNPNLLKDFIKKLVYRNAAGCFSGGKSATEYFLHYGVKKECIFEYGFTCLHDEDIIEKVVASKEKDEWKTNLDLPKKKIVLTVGQFIPRKGFDILIEAWNIAKTEDAYLIIIGGGPDREQYEDFIKKNHIENIDLIDFLPKEKLRDYYFAADVFVLPTREDVWGLVVNEAMAVGLPVLTTNMCNAGTQLIEDGINGYVVPVNNIEILAEKLESLLYNDNLNMIGENNLRKIKEYTIKNAADSHKKAIELLVKKTSN